MHKLKIYTAICLLACTACNETEAPAETAILGYELLNEINGHWVGTNASPFGFFDWFAFDFRPISASHSHSIYEGGTNQNIINSVFLADHEGKQQIMARNGGWLGNQYRATYFVLDKVETNQDEKYFRLVDAVGGKKRSFIEFSFKADSIFFDAYKDNSGSLDEPILHMRFKGGNRNPSYSLPSKELFNYPQPVPEVDLNDQFDVLIDPDSALFLEEADDPFPKSSHGHLSDLDINFIRNVTTRDESLLLYISKEELISAAGSISFQNIENTVIRTITIGPDEDNYLTTYLHPDAYYLTVFSDFDNNNFPSSGEYASTSLPKTIEPESNDEAELVISILIP